MRLGGFDATAAKATLVLLFIQLVATTVSADSCLGYCSGMYQCGLYMCYCPAAATESSCPHGCIYSDSGNCDDYYSGDGGDDGLSGGAKFGIALVVMAAIAAVMYVIWIQTKPKISDDATPKTAENSNAVAVDVEQAPPPQEPPVADDLKDTTIQPNGTKTVEIHGAAAAPTKTAYSAADVEHVSSQGPPLLEDVKETTIQPNGTVEIEGGAAPIKCTNNALDVNQPPLDDVKERTIKPDGTQTVEMHGEGQE